MKRITRLIKVLFRLPGVFAICICLSSNGQDPPGIEPRVFLPGTVSTSDFVEFGCCFSPNGDEFYFSRTVGDSGAIYLIERMEDAWATPVKLEISNAQYYSEPFITSDNEKMFFSEFHMDSGQARSTISMVSRDKNGWTESRVICDGMFATVSLSGNMYYTNNNERAIYRCIYNNGSAVHEKVIIENCLFPVSHPCIASDESFLIYGGFNQEGQAKGEWADLYISFSKGDGTFGIPINLGNDINNQYPNICPMISPDGKYLFYSNKGDIYWVDAKVLKDLSSNGL